jgi:hypothetical protein
LGPGSKIPSNTLPGSVSVSGFVCLYVFVPNLYVQKYTLGEEYLDVDQGGSE